MKDPLALRKGDALAQPRANATNIKKYYSLLEETLKKNKLILAVYTIWMNRVFNRKEVKSLPGLVTKKNVPSTPTRDGGESSTSSGNVGEHSSMPDGVTVQYV